MLAAFPTDGGLDIVKLVVEPSPVAVLVLILNHFLKK